MTNIISSMNIKNVSIDGEFCNCMVSAFMLTHQKENGVSTEDPQVFFKEAGKYLKKHYNADMTQSSVGEINFHDVKKNMGVLMVIHGHKGSGKAEIAKQLKDIGVVVISPSDLKNQYKAENYYPCHPDAVSALLTGNNVAVINSFKKGKQFQAYIEYAKKNNVTCHVIHLLHEKEDNRLPDFFQGEHVISLNVKKESSLFIQSLKEKLSLSEDKNSLQNKNTPKGITK